MESSLQAALSLSGSDFRSNRLVRKQPAVIGNRIRTAIEELALRLPSALLPNPTLRLKSVSVNHEVVQ